MTQLAATARELHGQQYGETPFVTVSVPGTVNLFGDLTEIFEGLLIQFCLSQRLVVALGPRSDNQVRFFSREFNEKKRCTLQTLKYRKEDRWANFPKGAISLQSRDLVGGGYNVTIVSDIPIHGGASSSQALTLATVLAVSEMRGFRMEAVEAARMALEVEREFVRNPCLESAFEPMIRAGTGELLVNDLRSHSCTVLDFVGSTQFFLVQTNVPSHVFEDLFRDLSADLHRALSGLRVGRPGASPRDLDRSDIKALLGRIPEEDRRRALYVVEEMGRAQDSIGAIRNADWRSLGRLMQRSHEGLRDLVEVSCPEIDWLVKRAPDLPGVYGARMVTNASGASVLILADPEAEAALRALLEEYERIFSFHALLLPTLPSHGVEFH